MRDYKFDSAFTVRPRRRGRIIVALLIAAAVGTTGWMLLDRHTGTAKPTVAKKELGGGSARPVANDRPSSSEDEQMLSKPLALPPQSNVSPKNKPTAAAHPAAAPATSDEEPAESAISAILGNQPPATSANNASGLSAAPHLTWKSRKIVAGDSLAAIFKDRGLPPTLLHRIVHSGAEAAKLADIRPGQTLRFQTDDEGDLQQLVWVKTPIDSLHVTIDGDNIQSEWVNKNVETKIVAASATIQSSLYAAAKQAGLTYPQVLRLAALFSNDIDFSKDIRPGDQFKVLYEKRYLNGKELRNGPIVAAEFTNLGSTYTAFRFEDANGDAAYYNRAGRSKLRAFMRAPLHYIRISSRFSKHRWDPYLKRWAPHKGVDFAAPTGTPIMASANGRIVFRGQQRGYGNVVILDNGPRYQTAYAHMSRFAGHQRVGERVKRGEIIGYVGMTGWATGPHLHYEVRVNGVARNPLTVKLPMAAPVPKKELARFKADIAPLVADLANVSSDTMVAINNTKAK